MAAQVGPGIILLVVAVALTGCLGGDEPPADGEDPLVQAAEAAATEETGSITGQVISVELEVMTGIDIGAVNRTGGVVVTQTDLQGRYTFNDLAPGPYRVQVSDDCCRVATEQVRVLAGNVTEVNLQVQRLTPLDLQVPYATEEEWEGLVACGIATPSYQSTFCGFTDQNHMVTKLFNVTVGIREIVFGLEWGSADQSIGNEMKLQVRNRNCSGCSETYASITGPSPIIGSVDDASADRDLARFSVVNDTLDMQWEVNPGGVNVVYQQPFKLRWHEFYFQDAPEGFDPLAAG